MVKQAKKTAVAIPANEKITSCKIITLPRIKERIFTPSKKTIGRASAIINHLIPGAFGDR